jgi:hypothetical protein
MDTKTNLAEESSRSGISSPPPHRGPTPQMKRSHWIIFFAICFILGLLVFVTIIHVIDTTPSRAQLLKGEAGQ